jgi:hypothetical protein
MTVQTFITKGTGRSLAKAEYCTEQWMNWLHRQLREALR